MMFQIRICGLKTSRCKWKDKKHYFVIRRSFTRGIINKVNKLGELKWEQLQANAAKIILYRLIK